MTASDPELLLLLGLRLKNFAEPDVLAELCDLEVGDIEAGLREFSGAGLVQHRDGRVSGWSLTPDGRRDGERRLAAELDSTGTRADIAAAYHQFLDCNGELLAVCTRWQVKDAEANLLNEHDDAAYDDEVVAELATIDRQVQPICDDLTAGLARFGGFGPRLANALELVQQGQIEWFAKPLIDSYHTVWFDLHETLLATLGIERSTEGAN